MKRRVLLVEPNYKNKYPPMPLMKLSTYYKRNGDDVRFYKGDLKLFAARLLAEELYELHKSVSLARHFELLVRFIRLGRLSLLEEILEVVGEAELEESLREMRRRYQRKDYPQFDIVAVTTLFTFYWKETIDTIQFCKLFVREGRLLVGGIAATLVGEHIEAETGIRPIRGLLDRPGMLDENNKDIIDELPLDYSILDEIDYLYPARDAYFGYMTRGCIRNCPFCAVKILEPTYKPYLAMRKNVEEVEATYGMKRDLLLMDNNVFASRFFNEIVDEIKSMGFSKGATYVPDRKYDVAYRQLLSGQNDRASLRLILQAYNTLEKKLPYEAAGEFYIQRENNGMLFEQTATREGAIKLHPIVAPLFQKYFHPLKRKRALDDFNQGLDARLATEDKMKKLAETAINPLRIAFDHYEQRDVYIRAIRMAGKYGITNLSNYILYNFEDRPEELYERLRINVELCEEENVRIYSFPMKYHPIDDPRYFRNRDYLGRHWNRKFIRAVQAVLNSTKGKIGRGKSFFEAAFGRSLGEFFDILWMPEAFIIYRLKYDQNLAKEWRKAFHELSSEEGDAVKKIIMQNDFREDILRQDMSEKMRSVLQYYEVRREQ